MGLFVASGIGFLIAPLKRRLDLPMACADAVKSAAVQGDDGAQGAQL